MYEKVVKCTERIEWAQGLNLEALQTAGQLGQTESSSRRWFTDGLKGTTETIWEQNQKYKSNIGDDLKECGSRSYQMQLVGLIRSEQKLCHSQRLRGGHRADEEVLSPCCDRDGKWTEKCTWLCSSWDVLLIGKGRPFSCTDTRVCTESWLWEKNPLPHGGLEPASVLRLSF